MIVQLSPTSPAQLTDLERLDRLHAECPGELAAMQLAHWCSVGDDSEHVWLDVAECRSIGRAARGGAWGTEYDAMVEYATTKGWTDATGSRLRAHVEHVEPVEPFDSTASTSAPTGTAGD